MDKLGQEIEVGNYILIMRKGTGWDKGVYFSVDFVYRVTPANVFYGNPEDKSRIKKENTIVITEEQLTSYCVNQYGEEDGMARAQESINFRNEVLGL